MNFLHIVDRLHMSEEETQILQTLKDAYKEADFPIFENLESKPISRVRHVSSAKKFIILCERGFINSRRNPGASQAWISLLIIIWIVTDLLFHDLGNSFTSIQNINGILFFITIVAVMNGNSSSSMGIPCERPIYVKEYSQGVYGTLTYVAAKMASEFPLQVLAAIVTSAMVYFPVGLYNGAGNFFVFFAVFLLSYLMGSGLGHIIGALCKTEELAFGLSQMFIAPLITYGGLVVNVNRLNSAFSWIRYITPYFYAFGALSVNQYKDMEFDCDPDGPECDPLNQLGFDSQIQAYILPIILYVIITRIIAYWILKLLGMKAK
ncbi:unnamed protein product [Blepharisma stoltei]|uniref:ABC-2 type transporter transmembrane domain-containing protein n=1 Tax=Blepharisma stoltei TaxID=1481888 RepID=A0AAU9JWD0_9CILI|nr:unnamed protein product [Blepharisma stoltei]